MQKKSFFIIGLAAASTLLLGGLSGCQTTPGTSSGEESASLGESASSLPETSSSEEEKPSSSSEKDELALEEVRITNREAVSDILVEEGATIQAEALPSGVPQEFSFKSSDETIVSVDAMGRLTAVAPGQATITVTSNYRGVEKSDSVEVTVTNTFFSHSPVGMELSDFTHELDETNPYVVYGGGGFMFFRNCFGTQWYAETDITIDSFAAGELYAKAGLMSTDFHDQNGLYYFLDCPLGENNALIDAWKAVGINDRINGSYDIGQYNWPLVHTLSKEEMGIEGDEPCLRFGDKFTMGLLRDGGYYHLFFNGYHVYSVAPALLDPEEPTYPCFTANNVTATLSNYSFLEAGDPELEALLDEANATVAPTKVEIAQGEGGTINLETTDFRLTAKVTSESSTVIDDDLEWSSSDETVATVDERGYITPLAAGETTITAKASYPYSEASDTYLLKVVDGILVEEIVVPASLSLHETEEKALGASILPDGANPALTYEVEDPSIASVDSEGNVTGLKAGTTTVAVASSENPAIREEVALTVLPSVIDYRIPSYYAIDGTNQLPLIDYSHMDDEEDPYVSIADNGSGVFQNGAYLPINGSGTKWMVTYSFDQVSFFNGEVWGKLFVTANTADGSQGVTYFVDSVIQSWTLGGWRDVGYGHWSGSTATGYKVGADFKPGQGVIPAGWRDKDHVPSGGSSRSPLFGLIRDGIDYYFLIDGEIAFKHSVDWVAAATPSTPVIGGFNAAMEVHDISFSADEGAIDEIIATYQA